MIRNSTLESIGNTPLVKLKHASEATGCTILGKAEFMNPGQSVKDRAARTVRNPRTGEPIEVAATKVCSFKPGTALKRRLEQEG